MSFLRHREPHQTNERSTGDALMKEALFKERARPFGHALAHRADESPVGYSAGLLSSIARFRFTSRRRL